MYECMGKLVATTHEMSRVELPEHATFEVRRHNGGGATPLADLRSLVENW